jgi:hypothetical protein
LPRKTIDEREEHSEKHPVNRDFTIWEISID